MYSPTLDCTVESPEKVLRLPVPQPHLRPTKSASQKWDLGIRILGSSPVNEEVRLQTLPDSGLLPGEAALGSSLESKKPGLSYQWGPTLPSPHQGFVDIDFPRLFSRPWRP